MSEPDAATATPIPGRASGVGSWPGEDVLDAARTVFGELDAPHVPFLVELPGRGPGADLIGRGAALLTELPVDLQPSGWRLVDRPGRDLGRAQSFLRTDLDVLAEVADGYSGVLKLQACGPWTLAASLQLPRLERVVADPGAVRDVVSSLADGVARHIGEVRRLVPGATIVLQLDEPSLPAVLAGALPTSSGWGRLRAIDPAVARTALTTVLDAAEQAGAVSRIVHCCAPEAPVELLVEAGVTGLSLDVALLGRRGWEALAGPIEAGLELWAGAVPTTGSPGRPPVVADAVASRWRRLGLAETLLDAVLVTPACGLAGLSPTQARTALTVAKQAAGVLAEQRS